MSEQMRDGLDLEAIARRTDEAWKVSHRGTHIDLVADARVLLAAVAERDAELAELRRAMDDLKAAWSVCDDDRAAAERRLGAVAAWIDSFEPWNWVRHLGDLRAVLAPVSGAVEGAEQVGDMDAAIEAGAAAIYRLTYPGSDWTVQTEPMRRGFLAAAREAIAAGTPHLQSQTTPVAVHEQEVRADAWDVGVYAALNYAVRESDGITLRLDLPNPYRAARASGVTE